MLLTCIHICIRWNKILTILNFMCNKISAVHINYICPKKRNKFNLLFMIEILLYRHSLKTISTVFAHNLRAFDFCFSSLAIFRIGINIFVVRYYRLKLWLWFSYTRPSGNNYYQDEIYLGFPIFGNVNNNYHL